MSVDAVHVYWRPGCGYCSSLRRKLERLGIETIEHNIWDDAADAATVRAHAGGDETVPTVVIGEVGLVNPSPHQVTEHLGHFAPHLLPAGFRAPEPGPLQRLFGLAASG